MQKLMKAKAAGLRESMADFSQRVSDFNLHDGNLDQFSDMVVKQMESLGFDRVAKDLAGNITGVVKGCRDQQDMLVVSHADVKKERDGSPLESSMVKFKAGIISGIYAGALIKRAMLPLSGDLTICCVPRMEDYDVGVKYLFEGFSKARIGKIKGVVLCEPTDCNVYLGHKGRMEYEIVVKGKINRDFIENKGMNILGAMFPLINELEKLSHALPNDGSLGRSGLKIKDVRYSGYRQQDDSNEFSVIVDRVFIPEENLNEILDRAKTIARGIYKGEDNFTVNTAVARQSLKTHAGLDVSLEKEVKPWAIGANNRFVLDSLEVLGENGIESTTGHWKNILTAGSHTYGELKIPTIGFGAGKEEAVGSGSEAVTTEELSKAVYALGLIIERNIGVPVFGWNSDEI